MKEKVLGSFAGLEVAIEIIAGHESLTWGNLIIAEIHGDKIHKPSRGPNSIASNKIREQIALEDLEVAYGYDVPKKVKRSLF